MSYVLGVDLGTTYTAAATAADGKAEIFPLGTRVPSIPSVVLLRDDGTLLTGEAAERRAVSEPGRAATQFKRRLGDPTPLLLGGTPYGSESLTAALLGAVTEQVTARQGAAPSRVAITHPAGYGDYKLDLLRQAARLADIADPVFLSEPQAAALHYSTGERLDPGNIVAVYDFGGGTFDASVLERTETGFRMLGSPEGMDRFGGIDLDDAVLAHVRRAVEPLIDDLEVDSDAAITALARLRYECRAAKEALSEDTDTAVQVMLPNVHTEVRLTRTELEDLVRPRLRDTLATMYRAVQSAGIDYDSIDRVLLVGGSSRMPLVAEMVRQETGRPVAVDVHPKQAVALGAAEFARAAGPAVAPPAAAPPTAVPPAPGPETAATVKLPEPTPPLEAAPGPAPEVPQGGRRRRPAGVIAAGIAAIAVIAGFSWWAAGREDTTPVSTLAGNGTTTPSSAPTSVVAAPPAIPGFDLQVTNGTYWEFSYEYRKSSFAQGSDPVESESLGGFRLVLGEETTIDGKTAHRLHLQTTRGVEAPFEITRWRYLAFVEDQILGSTDGQSLSVVFNAAAGIQAGGGLFANFADGALLVAKPGRLTNAFTDSQAIQLGRSFEENRCETFESVGTICAGERDTDLQEREFFRKDVGPFGYGYRLSFSDCGGGFCSGATTVIDIGLVDFSLEGEGPVTAPTTSLASVEDLYFARTDTTDTFSVEVPIEWAEIDTSPFVDEEGIEFPTIVASPDISQLLSKFDVPGFIVQFAPVGADPPELNEVMDTIITSDAAVCTTGDRDTFDNPGFNAVSQLLFDCEGTDADLIYLAGYFDTRRDLLLTIVFQSVEADDLAHFDQMLTTLNLLGT